MIRTKLETERYDSDKLEEEGYDSDYIRDRRI